MKTKLIIVPAKYFTCMDCGGVFKVKTPTSIDDSKPVENPKYCSYCSKSKKKH